MGYRRPGGSSAPGLARLLHDAPGGCVHGQGLGVHALYAEVTERLVDDRARPLRRKAIAPCGPAQAISQLHTRRRPATVDEVHDVGVAVQLHQVVHIGLGEPAQQQPVGLSEAASACRRLARRRHIRTWSRRAGRLVRHPPLSGTRLSAGAGQSGCPASSLSSDGGTGRTDLSGRGVQIALLPAHCEPARQPDRPQRWRCAAPGTPASQRPSALAAWIAAWPGPAMRPAAMSASTFPTLTCD